MSGLEDKVKSCLDNSVSQRVVNEFAVPECMYKTILPCKHQGKPYMAIITENYSVVKASRIYPCTNCTK
jgi:hypothetical protein